MPLNHSDFDVYWSGRRWRHLKRLWPLGVAFGILAGGILLGALLA